MAQISPVLRSVDWGGTPAIAFWCPGCDSPHLVTYGAGCWSWDGNAERPTVSPSVLVTYNGYDADTDDAPPARCHSFVRDGRIEFCGDSTHALAGKAVPLPPWPEGNRYYEEEP